MGKFTDGQEVKAIHLVGGGSIRPTNDGEKIVVVMENGQMEAVPWFEVFQDGVPLSKWNAANIESVEL